MKKTPLFACHQSAKAKLVDFHGWQMPVQYDGIIKEHMRTRQQASFFDVSHMGEFRMSGATALEALQNLTSNDVSKLSVGQAQYSSLLYPNGTVVDDLTVYRLEENTYQLCVNASNIEKDKAWIRQNLTAGLVLEDISDQTALLAIQGPKSAQLLGCLTSADLAAIPYYHFVKAQVCGQVALIARMGYTGEDGFEVFVAAENATTFWDGLAEHQASLGAAPAGLGSRDTLRLEVCYPLYGNDLDDQHSILEAGLGWIVKFKKGGFIGKKSLEQQKANGIQRKLVAFQAVDKGIPRRGYPIQKEGLVVGQVTSGTSSPWLKRGIGLGYVAIEHSQPDTQLSVVQGERQFQVQVVRPPFYKRPS